MKRVVKDTIILLIFSLLVGGLGYLVRFILANKLTVSEYGLFYAVYSFIFFLAPFRDMGLSEAGVFFINKYRVKNNLIKIKSVLLTCIYSQLFITLVFFALILIFKNVLVAYYFKSVLAEKVLIIMSILFVVDFCSPLIGHFFLAYEKMFYFKLSDIIKNVIIFGVVLLLFETSMFQGAVVPAVAFLIGTIVAFLIIIALFFFKFSDILKNSASFNKKEIREIFTYSFPILLSTASTLVLTYSGTMLLTFLSSVESVGIYNVAYPAAFLVILLVSPVHVVIFPKVARFHHANDNESIRNVLELVYSNIAIFLLPLILAFVAYSDLIINIFFSSKFIAADIPFKIFALAAFFIFLWEFNANIMVATGQVQERMKLIFAVSATNLILGIILIMFFDVVGAALTAFASFAIMGILSARFMAKKYGFRINLWEQLKIFLCSLVFIASTYVLKYLFNMNIYIELFLVLSISCLLYLGALFLLDVLNKKRINMFKDFIFN